MIQAAGSPDAGKIKLCPFLDRKMIRLSKTLTIKISNFDECSEASSP